MKIVIFSDSHGDAETMCIAIEKEKPDMVVYLGDGIADTASWSEKYPGMKSIKVLGNVDSDKEEEWIKLAEIGGKRFLITHGHTFIHEFADGRQTDEDRRTSRIHMLKAIDEHRADILLHGHTHQPLMEREQTALGKTCWIMNPGRVGRKRSGGLQPTYGVLKIHASGTIQWRLIQVE